MLCWGHQVAPLPASAHTDGPGRWSSINGGGGGAVWHKASVSDCLPLAAPIGLSALLILTLCGPERVLVVSTEPPDDLSCLTPPGVGCPRDGLLPVPLTRCVQMHTPSPCWVCQLQHRVGRAGMWGAIYVQCVPLLGCPGVDSPLCSSRVCLHAAVVHCLL